MSEVPRNERKTSREVQQSHEKQTVVLSFWNDGNFCCVLQEVMRQRGSYCE